jgi:YegS/Rv2252/BmrU family lipid kinase
MGLKKKTLFLVNPAAGNGSTGMSWPLIASLLEKSLCSYDARLTKGPLDARVMAADALKEGFGSIICVGGDGTLNEVINGIMDYSPAIASEITVGFIPNGTGCDLAKSISVPKELRRAVRALAEDRTIRMDLGKIRHIDKGGRETIRYFHNIASLGLGGEVVRRVNRTSKRFGPFLSFIWATLLALLTYQTKMVSFSIDGSGPFDQVIWHMAVANGQFQGGGMWVAPGARVDDGLLDITIVGDLTLPRVFTNLHNLYNGKIHSVSKVTSFRGRVIDVFSGSEVFLDVDGEEPGTIPVRIEVVPDAISMIVEKPGAA